MENSNKEKLKLTIYTLLVIIVACIIFYFSSEVSTKSSRTSGKVIENTIKICEPEIKEEMLVEKVEKLQHLYRKSAHFLLYATLGFFTYNLFRNIKKNIIKNKKNTFKTYILLSQIFCSIYATTDEIHQFFVPGRSSQVSDVLLDSVGAFVGIMLSYLIINCIKNNMKRKKLA